MTAAPQPRDPGLQPERTVLAWQRSSLALAGASVLMARLTVTTAGVVALAAALSGLAHAAVIFIVQRRHYRRPWTSTKRPEWPTGVHAALLALQVALLTGLQLWHMLHRE
jgi:putative membrane protein